jgi:hypothetical protein
MFVSDFHHAIDHSSPTDSEQTCFGIGDAICLVVGNGEAHLISYCWEVLRRNGIVFAIQLDF